LEEKVSSLLKLLPADTIPSKSANTVVETSSNSAAADNATNAFAVERVQRTTPSSTERRGQFDVIDNGLITMATANILLDKYKKVHSTFFPFVIVEPNVDAATLRREFPTVFLAIVATCLDSDHMLQRRIGVEVKKVLCERVLVDNERNLDLLSGILVYLGWAHFHFLPQNKHSYMLLQMAVGLSMDLDLDRCPAHRDQRIGSGLCAKIGPEGSFHLHCRRTTAELRALLGCFYLSCTSVQLTPLCVFLLIEQHGYDPQRTSHGTY
jgi:hypothetical protein